MQCCAASTRVSVVLFHLNGDPLPFVSVNILIHPFIVISKGDRTERHFAWLSVFEDRTGLAGGETQVSDLKASTRPLMSAGRWSSTVWANDSHK